MNDMNDKIKALKQQADKFINEKKWDDVIDIYSQIINITPEHANAYNNRGNAYSAKGEYDRAIEDYNKALGLQPEYAVAYNNRGNAYSEKGEYDRAIEDYNKALGLQPEYAVAYSNRGNAYNYKGEHDRAIEDCNKALGLQPEDAVAYNNRGVAYSYKGEHDRAIEDYSKAIDLQPKYAVAYSNRGVAYSYKGDNKKALEDFSSYYEYGLKYGLKNRVIAYLAYQITSIAPAQPKELFKYFIKVNGAIHKIREKLHIKPGGLEKFTATHYCSLKTLKNMTGGEELRSREEMSASGRERFRLYNAAYMNDQSEGQVLLDKMEQEIKNYFYENEKPDGLYQPYYIGSFITGEENKDKIFFWQSYGKDNGIYAGGCNLIFTQEQFNAELKEDIIGMPSVSGDNKERKGGLASEKPVLFSVFYENDTDGKMKPLLEELNNALGELKEQIEKKIKCKEKLKSLGRALIDSVRYLFKSKHYADEQEARIVEFAEK